MTRTDVTRPDRRADEGRLLFHVGAHVIPRGHHLRSYVSSAPYASLIRQGLQALQAGIDATQTFLASDAFVHLPHLGAYPPELVFQEAVFEWTRLQITPTPPSRLAAIYGWRTRVQAERFRTAYRPQGVIHRCTLVSGTAVERDGALVAAGINLAAPLPEELARVAERAARYWRAEDPLLLPEMVIRGTVVVEATMAAGGPDE